MMEYFKKSVLLILVLSIILSFAACVQQDPAEPPATEPPAETSTPTEPEKDDEPIDYSNVKFEIVWWGNDKRAEQTIRIIEEFEARHPGLKVEVAYTNFNDYPTMLATNAAGNSMPDVFQMSDAFITEYANNGLLMPLDELAASGAIDYSNVSPEFLSGGIVNDKLYGQTCGVNSSCFAYDKALLEENGITISYNPTMTEFIDVCKQVYEKTGVKTSYPFIDVIAFEMYLRSLGTELFDASGKKVAFTAQQLADFWSVVMDIYDQEFFEREPVYGTDVAIANGETWVIWAYTNTVAGFETSNGKELGIIGYPTADNRSAAAPYLRPAMLWSISANTEYPELAAEFLSFYANEKLVYDISGTDRAVPINNEIRDYVLSKGTPLDGRVSDYLGFLSEAGNCGANPGARPAGFDEGMSTYYETADQIFYGLVEREDLLGLAQNVIDNLNAAIGG